MAKIPNKESLYGVALALLCRGEGHCEPDMKQGVIQEHYDLLRLVVDHGAYPVLVVDESNVIQMTNPATDRFFNKTASELVGQVFPFPVAEPRLPPTRTIESTNGDWIAEMHVEHASFHETPLFVVSIRDIPERAILGDLLRETMLLDEDTGLLNERGFKVLTAQQVKIAQRTGRTMLVLVTEIDDQASLVQSHGPAALEQAVSDTAAAMQQTFRESDVMARLDDGSFALVAVEAHPDSAGILVARLRDCVWDLNAQRTSTYQLSLSAGVARYLSSNRANVEGLLAQAREALLAHRREKGRLCMDRPRSA